MEWSWSDPDLALCLLGGESSAMRLVYSRRSDVTRAAGLRVACRVLGAARSMVIAACVNWFYRVISN